MHIRTQGFPKSPGNTRSELVSVSTKLQQTKTVVTAQDRLREKQNEARTKI